MSSGVVKLVQTTIFFRSVVWMQVPCTALSGLADVAELAGHERVLEPQLKVQGDGGDLMAGRCVIQSADGGQAVGGWLEAVFHSPQWYNVRLFEGLNSLENKARFNGDVAQSVRAWDS